MSDVSITFPGNPEFVPQVRRWTISTLGGDIPGVDLVVLVASELATNAIVHTASGEPGGKFTLHLATHADRWEVRVDDAGGPKHPEVTAAEVDDVGGRGLAVVSEVSKEWGVHGGEGARSVWAQIAFPCQEPSYG